MKRFLRQTDCSDYKGSIRAGCLDHKGPVRALTAQQLTAKLDDSRKTKTDLPRQHPGQTHTGSTGTAKPGDCINSNSARIYRTPFLGPMV